MRVSCVFLFIIILRCYSHALIYYALPKYTAKYRQQLFGNGWRKGLAQSSACTQCIGPIRLPSEKNIVVISYANRRPRQSFPYLYQKVYWVYMPLIHASYTCLFQYTSKHMHGWCILTCFKLTVWSFELFTNSLIGVIQIQLTYSAMYLTADTQWYSYIKRYYYVVYSVELCKFSNCINAISFLQINILLLNIDCSASYGR